MEGVGVLTSMWTFRWDWAGGETSFANATRDGVARLHISLLASPSVDTARCRKTLEAAETRPVCALRLSKAVCASRNLNSASGFLRGKARQNGLI